ncbi:serine/threonine-protein kinase [Couchioplanes azureus]|uniref:serine/threonine-protein kinase n=1 Tax=Couchioplanes caeruleus TaxID=56438 RepID=UPI00166FB78C|nr:serine/threonine-protein kinase [Couchioplanes caeruleus]GGQ49517.1 hypothetical protein GCM10010166_17410 [Couchioplanes caeruleus subsp. azureus]
MRSLAGRYRVEEAVGRGGSAVVHRGWDRTLKRPVAIKLFSPYRYGTEEPAVDVLREARAAAGLSHPNVARVYDYGEAIEGEERHPYLIMEFLEGDTLADELARTGALEWQRAVAICADTAAALAAAHARNLVHRDVKPRNVMLTPGGVKVLDFGIAAFAGQNSFDTHGRLWGTPATLAPEQLRGEPTYPAADVYALGLLLFECLTGSRAWPGTTVGEILAARHGGRTPRLPRIAGLPREIIRLYDDCTAEEADRRPSAASAVEVLRRAIGRLPAVRPAVARVTAATTAGGVAALTAVGTAALDGVPAGSAAVATAAGRGPALAALGRVPALTAIGNVPGAVVGGVRAIGRTRSRRRVAATASMAVAAAIVSILGLQIANGGAAPHGRQAEAAADGAAGAAGMTPTPQVMPRPTASAPPRDLPAEADHPVRKPPGDIIREVVAPPAATVTWSRPATWPTTTMPTAEPTATQHTPTTPPPATTEPTTPPTVDPTTPPPTETTTIPQPSTETTTPPPATTEPTPEMVLAETTP